MYRDIGLNSQAKESLNLADYLIVIQDRGLEELEESLRPKTRIIYQSSEEPIRCYTKSKDEFQICVIGHLREVKDPFLTALAGRSLPDESKIKIIHAGEALTDEMDRLAKEEMILNPRYIWAGKLAPHKIKTLLGESQLMVISSLMEGGANVISEALMHHTPVLASKISGNIGMLGEEYCGYFSVGKVQALKDLLLRCEFDSLFLNRLKGSCEQQRHKFSPNVELKAWNDFLSELKF